MFHHEEESAGSVIYGFAVKCMLIIRVTNGKIGSIKIKHTLESKSGSLYLFLNVTICPLRD